MKRIRLEKWGSQFLTPRCHARPPIPFYIAHQQSHNHSPQCRFQSTSSTAASRPSANVIRSSPEKSIHLESLPSPHASASTQSAKLAALHARLALPTRLPLQTLARTLVDYTADPNPAFNNSSLSIFGRDLLRNYMSEWLLCHYPRLPVPIIFAAENAYIGNRALAALRQEWGVELAAAPGGEVDPGLLQFKRVEPGTPINPETGEPLTGREWAWKMKRGTSGQIVNADNPKYRFHSESEAHQDLGTTAEKASERFVRAVMGALYLHGGRLAAKRFFRAHILSRHLDMASLFDFKTPQRDLSRLCAREGWEPPIARLISETGRLSRHPVFVVGVYSGKDKLGEGVGSSLDEGRVRAAAAALRSYYLYQPVEVILPSDVEGSDSQKRWVPAMVDPGEVLV